MTSRQIAELKVDYLAPESVTKRIVLRAKDNLRISNNNDIICPMLVFLMVLRYFSDYPGTDS